MDIYNMIYLGLLLIALVTFLVAFKQKDTYVKLVISLLVLWLFTTGTAWFLVKFDGFKNNLFLFHICTPLEYVILALLYRSVIVNTAVKKMIMVSIPVFVVTSILFSAFLQLPSTNNSYAVIMESVLVVFLSLIFLREVLVLQQATVLHRLPMFWISVGILFFYTGNLIILGMLNYLVSHSLDVAKRIYRISYIFHYLLFLLLITAALCTDAVNVNFRKQHN